MFGRWSNGWDKYQSYVHLANLEQVRSIDPLLNSFVGASKDLYCKTGQPMERLSELPALENEHQYYQFVVLDPEDDQLEAISDLTLLGYDLTGPNISSGTSALLNCGVWEGRLAEISNRRNKFGLLSFGDAVLATKLLPEEWGVDEPHAVAVIRALYEINPALRDTAG